jgi:hypothetical protein
MSSMKCWNIWAALCRPKNIKGNSNRPNGVVLVVFCIYIVGMDGDLTVNSHQIDLREEGTTKKLVGVAVGDGPDV